MWMQLAATLISLSPAGAADPLSELGWLAGAWCNAEQASEEHWLPAKGGLMLGLNRGINGERASFEFMRIQADAEGLAYFAQPGGAPPTRFGLSSLEGQKAVFSNPAHDYPKRVLYWREGTALHAQIDAGSDESQPMRFSWQACE